MVIATRFPVATAGLNVLAFVGSVIALNTFVLPLLAVSKYIVCPADTVALLLSALVLVVPDNTNKPAEL